MLEKNLKIGKRSKQNPGYAYKGCSLQGAAVRGDMDMVQLSLYPPSRTIPPMGVEDDVDEEGYTRKETILNSILVLGEKPGSITERSKLHFHISGGIGSTSSPTIYQHLRSFLSEDGWTRDHNYHLAIRAEAGDIVMVRHLLDIGRDLLGEETFLRARLLHPPLVGAVRGWHEDVVDVLLERGADLNDGRTIAFGTVLTAAAKAGSMVMLRKLLDAGAKIKNPCDTETLKYAVKLEHTAMVKLLLRMGAGNVKARKDVLRMAKKEGLESMVGILGPWVSLKS
ncbi:ankyrin repeat domain-containing protein [Candidatus Bathyarchaeota archaeon]|nr:ankyrin repeat domain-containing protein [Candidatus Bathyarchaeota archaeon]